MTDKQDRRALFRDLGRYSALGLEMAIAVILGLAIGYYLDKWLGTRPRMTGGWLRNRFAAGGRVPFPGDEDPHLRRRGPCRDRDRREVPDASRGRVRRGDRLRELLHDPEDPGESVLARGGHQKGVRRPVHPEVSRPGGRCLPRGPLGAFRHPGVSARPVGALFRRFARGALPGGGDQVMLRRKRTMRKGWGVLLGILLLPATALAAGGHEAFSWFQLLPTYAPQYVLSAIMIAVLLVAVSAFSFAGKQPAG